MSNNTPGCCCVNSGCCSPKQEREQIIIDFLYLDLSVCTRCQGAESNLDDAINEVSVVLNAAGYEILVNKINISSKVLAEKHEFISSPTIRINGNDIDLEVNETPCKDCGDICGDNVDCRVWVYEGIEYAEPPKPLIVNAILKEIYSGNKAAQVRKDEYVIPKNLEVFFDGVNNKNG